MKILRILIVVLIAVLTATLHSGCKTQSTAAQAAGSQSTEVRDVTELTDADKARFRTYLEQNGQDPIDYIVGKFAQHDLVFLGETHQVRENCRFVADLIEPLHEAGVHVLVSEFLRSGHTPQVDALLTAEQFDESAAVDLFRDNPWPTWGFREYVDILQGAWKLNRTLPAGAPRFRVIGMDSDWSQYALWFETEDRSEVSQTMLAREKHMTAVLRDEILESGQKALVHAGYVHTVTCHGIYVATVLREEYGQRVFQVALHRNHGPGRGSVPITLFLEESVADAGGEAVGFDIVGSPYASLVDRQTMYWRMKGALGFENFAEGYVFLAPLEELHATSWIEGFITEERFDQALAVSIRMGWVKEGECTTAAELDAKLAERF